jgi:glucokinase
MPNSEPALPVTIGIDLGGTQVRAGLVRDGAVLARAARPTDIAGGPRGVLAQFDALVAEVTAAAEVEPAGIGICAPGPLDSRSGVVLDIPTLPGWRDFPMREAVATRYGLPALLENDGIAAAFGEWQFGAGRGVENLVFVTVSTGIGGGIVADGRLLRGHRGMAGHVGHLRLAPEGPRCPCGGIGCFEAFASGSALGRRARDAAARAGGFLAEAARHEHIEARHAVAGARAGDLTCRALLDEETDYLVQGLVSLVHLFSPELIVLGGGVSQALDLIGDRLAAGVRERVMPAFREVRIVPAALGDNCGLIGAAALATHFGEALSPGRESH